MLSAGEFFGPFYVRLETRIDGMAWMTRRKILPMINRCRRQLHERHEDQENVPERIFAKHGVCGGEERVPPNGHWVNAWR